ncbi:hypothetical protein [Yoonia algicola]|uniref:Uncharacterized protein n=1 Tax=Yoonia algicola TaxID=3137368 RepID=A0AAN0M9C8_9RHOB
MTNVEGLGATRLVENLLPELLALNPSINKVLIPNTGQFKHINGDFNVETFQKKRFLPKSISRAIEILFPRKELSGPGPCLVLGDMPIRKVSGQVVLVHNPHLVAIQQHSLDLGYIKTSIMQFLFSLNVKYVKHFIVQTDLMKSALCKRYKIEEARVHVVAHPPSTWVVEREQKKRKKLLQ